MVEKNGAPWEYDKLLLYVGCAEVVCGCRGCVLWSPRITFEVVLHCFVVVSRLWKCDKPRLCDGDDDLGDLERHLV